MFAWVCTLHVADAFQSIIILLALIIMVLNEASLDTVKEVSLILMEYLQFMRS